MDEMVCQIDEKVEAVRDAILRFHKVADKYARINRQPIRVDSKRVISTREVHTIQAIGDRHLVNVTDVAKHFGITKSAASQIATKLEKKGYLVKTASSKSNKELELVLTELGWLAYKAHERFHGEGQDELIERLKSYPIRQIVSFALMLDLFDEIMSHRLA